MFIIKIKSKLKDVRGRKGITVRKLAEMTGLSKTYISEVENDHKIPTIYTLCLLAVHLDVCPEELYSYIVEEILQTVPSQLDKLYRQRENVYNDTTML